jgi:hypothetical protein
MPAVETPQRSFRQLQANKKLQLCLGAWALHSVVCRARLACQREELRFQCSAQEPHKASNCNDIAERHLCRKMDKEPPGQYEAHLADPGSVLPFPYGGCGEILVVGNVSKDERTFFADSILAFKPRSGRRCARLRAAGAGRPGLVASGMRLCCARPARFKAEFADCDPGTKTSVGQTVPPSEPGSGAGRRGAAPASQPCRSCTANTATITYQDLEF